MKKKKAASKPTALVNLLNRAVRVIEHQANEPVNDDLICHRGLVPTVECCRCRQILAARSVRRQLIKALKELRRHG